MVPLMSDSDENSATPPAPDDGGIAVEVDASDLPTPPDSPAARAAALEGQLAAAEEDPSGHPVAIGLPARWARSKTICAANRLSSGPP